MLDPARAQSRESGEFAEGEMRVAQGHHVHPIVPGAVELAPTGKQAGGVDVFLRQADVALQDIGRVEGFRRYPGDVLESDVTLPQEIVDAAGLLASWRELNSCLLYTSPSPRDRG